MATYCVFNNLFTAWQLTAGGILLVPLVLFFEPNIPIPLIHNLFGFVWLCVLGAAVSYMLWFHGVSRIEPAVVSLLGFLSPGTAVLLGWLFLNQTLSGIQIIGIVFVIGSIWLGINFNRITGIKNKSQKPNL